MARPRLGITASRKVGGAVVRHGLKRQVREAFRRFVGRERLPAMDLVVHLKPAAASSLSNELRGEIQQALQRLVDRTGRVG